MPGYTHLQRAQPIYLSHHLLAYFWMLAARPRALCPSPEHEAGRLPLGAGALAGVKLDTDRELPRARSSASARSSRGTRSTRSPGATSSSTTCRRPRPARPTSPGSAPSWCCGRARSSASASCPTRGASGSSMMPREKNPDAAELLRAKAPRVVGHLAALHGVIHALPLTYNKDLQEDKEHLFDAVDTIELTLAAAQRDARGLCASIASGMKRRGLGRAAGRHRRGRPARAPFGVPFREAHGVSRGSGAHGARRRQDSVAAHAARSSPRTDEVLRPHTPPSFFGVLQQSLPGSSRRSPRVGPRHARGAKADRAQRAGTTLDCAKTLFMRPDFYARARCSRSPAS